MMSVGYHVDDQKFAPNGWLTAAVWDWTKLFPDLVTQAIGRYLQARGRSASASRTASSTWRPSARKVPKDVQDKIAAAKAKMAGDRPVPGLHRQPIKDQTRQGAHRGRHHADDRVPRVDGLARRGRRRDDPALRRQRSRGGAETHGPVSNSSRGLQQTERHAGHRSRPYAWPYHGAIDPAQTALLLFTDDADARGAADVSQRSGRFVDALRSTASACV